MNHDLALSTLLLASLTLAAVVAQGIDRTHSPGI